MFEPLSDKNVILFCLTYPLCSFEEVKLAVPMLLLVVGAKGYENSKASDVPELKSNVTVPVIVTVAIFPLLLYIAVSNVTSEQAPDSLFKVGE